MIHIISKLVHKNSNTPTYSPPRPITRCRLARFATSILAFLEPNNLLSYLNKLTQTPPESRTITLLKHIIVQEKANTSSQCNKHKSSPNNDFLSDGRSKNNSIFPQQLHQYPAPKCPSSY